MIPKHIMESKLITDEQWEEYQKLKEDLKVLFEENSNKENVIIKYQDNWNELEETILKEIEKCKEDEKIIRQNKIPKFYDIGVCGGIHGTCKFILDKMKEIKEGNKNE